MFSELWFQYYLPVVFLGYRDDVIKKLQQLSLEEKVQKKVNSSKSTTLTSQYQLNYRPMPVGVRKDVWEEGFRYRNQRKKNGFNHFKLEWKIISDRK